MLNNWLPWKIGLSKQWIENEEALRRRGIVQGGIYLFELGENVGSEQNSNIGADRPVIVISNNLINSTASNIIVAPLSKTLKYKVYSLNNNRGSFHSKRSPHIGSFYFFAYISLI